jgi:hypothetical protein
MDASSAGKREYWGQMKMSQVLNAFGLLDFTMLRPVLAWRSFLNLRTVYFFNFPYFFSDRDEPQIMNQWIRGDAYDDCTQEYGNKNWVVPKHSTSQRTNLYSKRWQ